ncbi:hypothetical protein [Luteolibacter soli]|uniref:SD-repeat containing protein B domain-containing protein n=1 Tax=Luteolibacter soli TaxID=3135280 RepID=A0ABU9AX63_9BACT
MNRTRPKNNSPRRLTIAISHVLALSGGLAGATDFPIGVSFAENAAYLLGAAESAGAPGYEQVNWNNRGRWGNPVALNDNTGATTAVTLKWDATGIWANNANETLGGNNKLMKGYLDSNGAAITNAFNGVFGTDDDKPTILVTGLDAWMTAKGLTSFSVVIYADGDSAAGDRATKVWLANADTANPVNGDPGLGSDLTSRIDIVDNSNWGTNPTFTRVTGASGAGNYTIFSGLTAGSFYIRLDEAGTNPFRCPINGFQIIGTNAPLIADSDGDGMPDSWEINHGLNPNDNGSIVFNNGASGDPDGDGRTNVQEYNGGINSTDPQDADSDDDKLNDGGEAAAGTNPLDPDSDDDSLPDGWEVTYSLNPLDDGTVNANNGPNGDPDGEGLLNYDEFIRGTNPRDANTDHDGYDDFVEDKAGTWGGITATGTDPTKADTDNDGIIDGNENPDVAYVAGVTSGTDPNLADTDGDGTTDRWEFLLGTNPKLDSSNLPTVAVNNPSFEVPEAPGTFFNGVATGWTFVNGPAANDTFVESLTSIGVTGGQGAQYAGIQEIGAYLYQDTGVAFAPNTTYLIDLAGGYRNGYPTGVVEFGFFSSNAIGTAIPGYTGRIDENGALTASGNPDADNVINKLRDASCLATIGTGSLARPASLVTGSTPPPGNLVVFIRHASGDRVMFDNVRILAVPNSLDSDGDSLPDAWEVANRLDPRSSTGVNGSAGDPDGDGFSNAAELAAGSNPKDATSTPVVAAPVVISSGFNGAAFELTVTNLTLSKSYVLARGTNLTGFSPVGSPVTGATIHTFSDPTPPAVKAFYRIEEAP